MTISGPTLTLELIALGVRESHSPRDAEYFCPDARWLERFGKWLALHKPSYLAERWDCDEFAMWAVLEASKALVRSHTLKGPASHTVLYAEVILRTGVCHAINLVRCDNEQWYLLEPQTGTVTLLADSIRVGFIRSLLYVWL